jgi:hypothetical protein
MGNWFAGLFGRKAAPPLAHLLRGHSVGQGFPAVWDSVTGRILFRPSPSVRGAPVPQGWVPRGRGHALVSSQLGGNPANHQGFAFVLQADGTLAVTWRSGVLNRTPDNLVPEELRPKIVEAIEEATGCMVSSQ